jgi:uncharacterized FlgJ-related protein
MAIAAVPALHSYSVQHSKGVAPGQWFFAEYLKPFLERELLEARLDELYKLSHFGKRERAFLDLLHRTFEGVLRTDSAERTALKNASINQNNQKQI